jgi:hypothetical protein
MALSCVACRALESGSGGLPQPHVIFQSKRAACRPLPWPLPAWSLWLAGRPPLLHRRPPQPPAPLSSPITLQGGGGSWHKSICAWLSCSGAAGAPLVVPNARDDARCGRPWRPVAARMMRACRMAGWVAGRAPSTRVHQAAGPDRLQRLRASRNASLALPQVRGLPLRQGGNGRVFCR